MTEFFDYWGGSTMRVGFLFLAVLFSNPARAEESLAKQLAELDAGVIVRGKMRVPPLAGMLPRDAEAKLRQANRADTLAWEKIHSRVDWEAFRNQRLKALRDSLGPWPEIPQDLKIRITGSRTGDGYRVENLVYQTRPGWVAAANLYHPAKPRPSMPGILLSHSHSQTKSGGYQQDMAMTWARAGCLVLVPDHPGHGERRQHPFGPEPPFDYHGRYDNGIQLHLVGESLMGWIVWDLMRGLDVLLAQKGVDPGKILVISDPAGGGDPAALLGALDPRVACTMVNNFGGPEPENPYPLPRDAETSFDFAGTGSWESTRNLRLSARDGFLPWTILASIAPRKLIYYHEFYWDRDQDPVWKRLQKVYGFYQAQDSLTGMGGQGFVVGTPPENTHWLAINREIMYPLLEKWFAIPNPGKEYKQRLPQEDLACLTEEVRREYRPQSLVSLTSQLADQRLARTREERAKWTTFQQRERLREEWRSLLGNVEPAEMLSLRGLPAELEKVGTIPLHRFHLLTEPGIVVPVILLSPSRPGARAPLVVCLAQEGKQAFLKERAGPIAELLNAGAAVALLDVRGTGETRPGESRDRTSPACAISSSEWMVGQSLLGGRLRDLRSVLKFLRKQPGIQGDRIILWGDSFAPVNGPERDLKIPHSGNRPPVCEPLGGLLALLGGLFEDDVRAIYIRGGLSDYRSVLDSPFPYLPHDTVVPGLLTTSDLPDLAAALGPRSLWLNAMVDGSNQAVSIESLRQRYRAVQTAYDQAGAARRLRLGDPGDLARWILEQR